MIERTLLIYRRAIVVGVHVIIVAASYYLAFLLRFNGAIDKRDFRIFAVTLPLFAAVQLGLFAPFRLYRGLWRYIGIRDLENIIKATLASLAVCYLLIDGVLGVRGYPRSVYFIDSLCLIVMLGAVRMAKRLYHKVGALEQGRRILILGAGDAGEMIVRDMLHNPFYNLEPIGFIDDDPAKVGRMIHNVPVLGTRRDLPEIIATNALDEILVAICQVEPPVLREILRSLELYKLPVRRLPSLRELLDGTVTLSQIRNVSFEDLLQRGPAGLDPAPLRQLVESRRVLVTGAGGSIGSELCRQLSALNAGTLVLFERYENALYTIESSLRDRGTNCEIVPLIGDVTDQRRVEAAFERYRPNVVLHTAAHKHVPLVEENPCEAVKNNVRGTRIVAEAADRYGTERFILISTDKAVKPSSVMGATKQIAEMAVRQLSVRSATCFAIVRFGNVLGSNGSVVPRFIEQIKAGGPVTVTHPQMERFFMTIPEAVNLVLHAATLKESGAVYALDMGAPIKIVDMAHHLIQLYGLTPGKDVEIVFTGLRPGEKLREQLVDEDEKAEPSTIKQIFKVRGESLAELGQLNGQLMQLEALAHRGKEVEVNAKLAQLVLGFHPTPAPPPLPPSPPGVDYSLSSLAPTAENGSTTPLRKA